MERPVVYVLAGVNGAGKSSIGGHLLEAMGLSWFNPDAFARELRAATGCPQEDANAQAWQEGMRRLADAVRTGAHFAFETTLGGNTVPQRLHAVAATHDLLVWFAGLDTPERHIARVAARVAVGGHAIPDAKIRERYPAALANLVALMPVIALLQVCDYRHQRDEVRERSRIALADLRFGNRVAPACDAQRDARDVSFRRIEPREPDEHIVRRRRSMDALGHRCAAERGFEREVRASAHGRVEAAHAFLPRLRVGVFLRATGGVAQLAREVVGVEPRHALRLQQVAADRTLARAVDAREDVQDGSLHQYVAPALTLPESFAPLRIVVRRRLPASRVESADRRASKRRRNASSAASSFALAWRSASRIAS